MPHLPFPLTPTPGLSLKARLLPGAGLSALRALLPGAQRGWRLAGGDAFVRAELSSLPVPAASRDHEAARTSTLAQDFRQ